MDTAHHAAEPLSPAQFLCCQALGLNGGSLKATEWQRATGHSRSHFSRLRDALLVAGMVTKAGAHYVLTGTGTAALEAPRSDTTIVELAPELKQSRTQKKLDNMSLRIQQLERRCALLERYLFQCLAAEDRADEYPTEEAPQ